MARSEFGGTISDFVFKIVVSNGEQVLGLTSATLTFWTAKTGGTRHTDLLVGGAAVTSVSVPADGQVPTFSGPDGVRSMWADAGAGRVLMLKTVVQSSGPIFTPTVLGFTES